MESSSIVYTRILKDHMAQFMNKNVTVVGRYKGRLGNKLTLETGDNGVLIVENCDIKFEVDPTFLEVRGTVKNANTLILNEMNEIPEEEKEPFDLENYNKSIKYSIENFRTLFV